MLFRSHTWMLSYISHRLERASNTKILDRCRDNGHVDGVVAQRKPTIANQPGRFHKSTAAWVNHDFGDPRVIQNALDGAELPPKNLGKDGRIKHVRILVGDQQCSRTNPAL